jgi:hypothetical protein
MPVRLKCACARTLVIKETLAGKRVKCPACAQVVLVPLPEPESDADADAVNVLLTKPAPPRRSEQIRVRPKAPEAISELPVLPAPPRRPADEPPPKKKYSWAKEGDRPSKSKERQKHKPRERSSRVVFEEGWFGSVSAGALGGLLMMVIAVVWFVLGYLAGWIYFYPPVLFVVGFIAFVRGLSGEA